MNIPLCFEGKTYIRYRIENGNTIKIIECSRKKVQQDLISRVVQIPNAMTIKELGDYISRIELGEKQ